MYIYITMPLYAIQIKRLIKIYCLKAVKLRKCSSPDTTRNRFPAENQCPSTSD